jgi:hypothetical protein
VASQYLADRLGVAVIAHGDEHLPGWERGGRGVLVDGGGLIAGGDPEGADENAAPETARRSEGEHTTTADGSDHGHGEAHEGEAGEEPDGDSLAGTDGDAELGAAEADVADLVHRCFGGLLGVNSASSTRGSWSRSMTAASSALAAGP